MRWLVVACVIAGCGRLRFEPLGGDGDSGISDGGNGGDGGVDATPSPVTLDPDDHNIVFVTSAGYKPGMLGSLAAADAACATEANAAGLTGRMWVAWMSTSTIHARDRIASARGWVRPDGLPFVDQLSDLTAGRVLSPPALDANGVSQAVSGQIAVATGTLADGTRSPDTCGDLSSPGGIMQQGQLNSGLSNWTDRSRSATCNDFSRLYCFSVDKSAALPTRTISGRRAFLSTPWLPSGGLVGADAHCNANALAQSIGGSYRALLAVPNMPAATRFTDGAPWYRLDGMPLTATANDLLTRHMDVPLVIDAAGSFATVGSFSTHAFLGAMDPPAAAAQTCLGWTSSAGANLGTTNIIDTAPDLSAIAQQGCDTATALYCLEQ